MKNKALHLLLAAICLAFVAPSDLAAQKFLKKINKGLEKVNKTLDEINPNSTSAETGVSGTGAYSGLTVKFSEVSTWGDHVVAWFTMTNTTNSDLNIDICPTDGNYDNVSSYVQDADNQTYTGFMLYGNSVGDPSHITVPAGVTAKHGYLIKNVPETVTKFKKITVAGVLSNASGTVKSKKYAYTLSNADVKTLQNTDRTNMRCTHPGITVKYGSLAKDGDDMLITLTLTNAGKKDITVQFKDEAVYDDEGNQYEVSYGNLGNVSLPAGTPVKFTARIRSAAGITTFSLLRLVMSEYGFKIELKNQSVE